MMQNKKAFTLIELLIVITIIAILAATIIPNFVGFDTEARITATKTNLDSIRTRIVLFRAKEGRYPDSLEELLTTYYNDAGVQKPYLKSMPPEMLSDKKGNDAFIDIKSDEEMTNTGGWAYYTDMAEIKVNLSEPLDKKWGDYVDQKPSEW